MSNETPDLTGFDRARDIVSMGFALILAGIFLRSFGVEKVYGSMAQKKESAEAMLSLLDTVIDTMPIVGMGLLALGAVVHILEERTPSKSKNKGREWELPSVNLNVDGKYTFRDVGTYVQIDEEKVDEIVECDEPNCINPNDSGYTLTGRKDYVLFGFVLNRFLPGANKVTYEFCSKHRES